jgi:hypothetical protein
MLREFLTSFFVGTRHKPILIKPAIVTVTSFLFSFV